LPAPLAGPSGATRRTPVDRADQPRNRRRPPRLPAARRLAALDAPAAAGDAALRRRRHLALLRPAPGRGALLGPPSRVVAPGLGPRGQQPPGPAAPPGVARRRHQPA